MLVIDASAATAACASADGFKDLGRDLVAPPLMWSEVRCETPRTSGATRGLSPPTWGGARTYDAEYVALARILGCRLVTVDGRLRRGADRLGLGLS
jgi:predicted nucleic acid-binding protein